MLSYYDSFLDIVRAVLMHGLKKHIVPALLFEVPLFLNFVNDTFILLNDIVSHLK